MKSKLSIRIIIAAVAYMIVGYVMHTLSAIATMNYYLDPNYFSVWSKIMMPQAGPPPIEFTYYSLAFTFIVGIIYSYIYSRISSFFKTKNTVRKGVKYGLALFLIAGIPAFLSLYLLINLPVGLLIAWLMVDNLLTYLIGGIVIAKIIG